MEFALEAVGVRCKVFKNLGLDLPQGSTVLADKGYTDYDYEDLLEEVVA